MYGEKNPSCKLTQKQVDEIRGLKGLKTQKEIGEMFNISKDTISKIHTKKIWIKKV